MSVWQIVLVVYVLGTVISAVRRPRNPNEDYVDRTFYAMSWFVYAQLIAVGTLMVIVERLRGRKPAWEMHDDGNGGAHIIPGPDVDDDDEG